MGRRNSINHNFLMYSRFLPASNRKGNSYPSDRVIRARIVLAN